MKNEKPGLDLHSLTLASKIEDVAAAFGNISAELMSKLMSKTLA
jgi:hypothetical protein